MNTCSSCQRMIPPDDIGSVMFHCPNCGLIEIRRCVSATEEGNVCSLQKGEAGAFSQEEIFQMLDISKEKIPELISILKEKAGENL